MFHLTFLLHNTNCWCVATQLLTEAWGLLVQQLHTCFYRSVQRGRSVLTQVAVYNFGCVHASLFICCIASFLW